ncbi:unnamed protein product [Menidia menidia]|uniref:(Atlantic silverside) hypothetical protein n=1 Tax=Menidia menidia TaxID=238744 RepID=A0A8S4ANB9_9TELE|nr:unnamed protein product [Menidia menidia]
MTLTQVSTWFANARRRLKKENKVTWSPRACKASEDRGCEEDSDEAERPPGDQEPPDPRRSELHSDLEDFDLLESDASDSDPKPPKNNINNRGKPKPDPPPSEPRPPSDSTKPRIWSIAQEAEFPPCMMSPPPRTRPARGSPGRTGTSRGPRMELTRPDQDQQGSPVSSLREWVDGVFYGPPFQQPKPAQIWTPDTRQDARGGL